MKLRPGYKGGYFCYPIGYGSGWPPYYAHVILKEIVNDDLVIVKATNTQQCEEMQVHPDSVMWYLEQDKPAQMKLF